MVRKRVGCKYITADVYELMLEKNLLVNGVGQMLKNVVYFFQNKEF